MRNVIIIGNSGAARECYWLLLQIMERDRDLGFKGFLSFENYPQQLAELALLEIGNDDAYLPKRNDVFVIGTGEPALREKAYRKWKDKGAEFINLIHPDLFIPPSTEIGEANIIAYACFVSCNVKIGNANFLNTHVVLGHDVALGDANFIGSFSILQGHVKIGSRNKLAAQTNMLAKSALGDDNTVAPGSVVFRGRFNNVLISGNPAHKID